MNCKHVEKLIIESSELSAIEQSQLAVHLAQCSSCSAFIATHQKQQEIFERVKNWNAEIKNSSDFTDQIMEALPKQTFHPEKKANSIRSLFHWTPLQTGLAACSLVLALTFAFEFNRAEVPAQHESTIKNGVTLSSNQEKLIQAKRTRMARFSLEKIIQQENTFALSKND